MGTKKKRNNRLLREVRCRNDTLRSEKLAALKEKRNDLHRLVNEIMDLEELKCVSYCSEIAENLEKIDKQVKDNDDIVQNRMGVFEKTEMSGLDIIEYYEDITARLEKYENINLSKYFDRQVYAEGRTDVSGLRRMVGEVKISNPVSSKVENSLLSSTKMRRFTLFDRRHLTMHG